MRGVSILTMYKHNKILAIVRHIWKPSLWKLGISYNCYKSNFSIFSSKSFLSHRGLPLTNSAKRLHFKLFIRYIRLNERSIVASLYRNCNLETTKVIKSEQTSTSCQTFLLFIVCRPSCVSGAEINELRSISFALIAKTYLCTFCRLTIIGCLGFSQLYWRQLLVPATEICNIKVSEINSKEILQQYKH